MGLCVCGQLSDATTNYDQLKASSLAADTDAAKLATQINDQKAVMNKLNATVATKEVGRASLGWAL